MEVDRLTDELQRFVPGFANGNAAGKIRDMRSAALLAALYDHPCNACGCSSLLHARLPQDGAERARRHVNSCLPGQGFWPARMLEVPVASLGPHKPPSLRLG